MPDPRSQDGFTLPELLIVIVVLAILSAIALPAFVGQRARGEDATAKSDVSAMASLIEQCAVQTDDYRQCDSEAEITGEAGGRTGLPVGNGAGRVDIVSATSQTYRLLDRSRSGVAFRVYHPSSGPQERTCSPVGRGGCPRSGTW